MTILICKNSSVHLLRVSLYPIIYFAALLGLLHEYYFDRFNVCVIVCDCHYFCVIVCVCQSVCYDICFLFVTMCVIVCAIV